jgi:hypothetical protein
VDQKIAKDTETDRSTGLNTKASSIPSQKKSSAMSSVATIEAVKTVKPRKKLSAKDLGTLHLKGLYR